VLLHANYAFNTDAAQARRRLTRTLSSSTSPATTRKPPHAPSKEFTMADYPQAVDGRSTIDGLKLNESDAAEASQTARAT
jgi:hypothetical protein